MSTGDVPAEDALVGKTLSDRYRLLKKLGEGGMGVVYLAEHVMIEKKVALKILSPDLARRADLVARFLQEAKSASRIGHENVIDISDFGQSPDGFVYFAMEYLEGQDVGQALKAAGGPLPWERTKPMLLQICRALRAAHNRNIVHRDMKPENVFLIQRDGRPDFVKVLDFGIAKVMGLGDETPRLTRTGMIFGTPDYMSPEQAQGQKFDHRVDIYAVGCILFQMVTGDTPFKAESFMGILSKHMFEQVQKPSVHRPDLGIPPEIDAIVLKAMDKDPQKRYPDMTAMGEAIATVGGGSSADILTHQKLPTVEMGGMLTPPPVMTNIPGIVPPKQAGTMIGTAPSTPMTAAPMTAAPAAAAPHTMVGQRSSSTAILSEMPLGGTTPPVGEPIAGAAKKSNTAMIAVVIALVAAGGGGAAMYFGRPSATPAAAPPLAQPAPPVAPPVAPPTAAVPSPGAVAQPTPAATPAPTEVPGAVAQPAPGGKPGKGRRSREGGGLLPPLPAQGGVAQPAPPPPVRVEPRPTEAPKHTTDPKQLTPRELKDPFGN